MDLRTGPERCDARVYRRARPRLRNTSESIRLQSKRDGCEDSPSCEDAAVRRDGIPLGRSDRDRTVTRQVVISRRLQMSERAWASFGRGAAVFLICIALVCGLPRGAAAQAVSGTIVGTVTDSTGAVVRGAKVTISNRHGTDPHLHDRHGRRIHARRQLPTGTYW